MALLASGGAVRVRGRARDGFLPASCKVVAQRPEFCARPPCVCRRCASRAPTSQLPSLAQGVSKTAAPDANAQQQHLLLCQLVIELPSTRAGDERCLRRPSPATVPTPSPVTHLVLAPAPFFHLVLTCGRIRGGARSSSERRTTPPRRRTAWNRDGPSRSQSPAPPLLLLLPLVPAASWWLPAGWSGAGRGMRVAEERFTRAS